MGLGLRKRLVGFESWDLWVGIDCGSEDLKLVWWLEGGLRDYVFY